MEFGAEQNLKKIIVVNTLKIINRVSALKCFSWGW